MSIYTYHYTYLITNFHPDTAERYYIGVHSANKLDNNYLGSSAHLTSMLTATAEKVIIESWPTRALAMAHEIWLHGYYNVKDNALFYNRANQTSTGFDRSGFAMLPQTRDALLKANTGRPCSMLAKQKTSERNNSLKNPWLKENRTELLGNEFTSESSRACALNRVADGRHNFQNAAENHPQFKGYYHTPHGTFTSAPQAVTNQLTANHIRKYCMSEVVTRKMVVRSKLLSHTDIGKTFKEIGFWFEPI